MRVSLRARLVWTLALVTVAVMGLPSTTQASTGGYVAASYGKTATARVTRVADGDSFWARGDFNRDGTPEDRLIRLVGADTPERGYCMYSEATQFSTNLLTYAGGRGRIVTLSTDVPGATGQKDRLLYRVSVERNGTRYDLTEELLKRGLALWMPYMDQPTKFQRYHRIAEAAARSGVRLFAGDRCSAGPSPDANLKIDVQWESDPNMGEHSRIYNNGPGSLDVDNWIIRGGRVRRMRIPSGGPIAPGEMLTVHHASGTNTRLHRYLGSRQLWPDIDVFNPFPNGRGGGEGGYLLDPGGDVRAWQMYACIRSCAHPADGKFAVTDSMINPTCNDGQRSCWQQEFVELTNTSTVAVNVGRLVIDIAPWTVELPPTLTLQPDDRIVVWSGDGTYNKQTGAVTTHNFYLKATDYPPLTNPGDRVVMRTYHGHIAYCYSWGNVSC